MTNKIQLARYEEIIKQVLNNALNYEVNNRWAKNATVTNVTLTNDLSFAKIYIDCLNRQNISKIISNLNLVKGFLRTKVSKTLNIYKTPSLVFYPDRTIDYAEKIESLIDQINKENK